MGGKTTRSGMGGGILVALICGVICMFVGFLVPMLVNNSERAEAFTATADGVVERVEEKVTTSGKRHRKEYSYVTFVRFADAGGRSVVARCIAVAHSPRHRSGERVGVKYDPASPRGGCLIVGDADILLKEALLTLALRVGGALAVVVSLLLASLRGKLVVHDTGVSAQNPR